MSRGPLIDPMILDDIRARVPVSAVVGRRVKLAKAGREWKGLSPFKNERTPSFFVNDHKQFWHDFSSGKHGDIFNFIMETEGLDFRGAVDRCAMLAGVDAVDMPSDPPASAYAKPATRAPAGPPAPSTEAETLWKEAISPAGTPVMVYLDRRGVMLPDGVAGEAIRFHPACKFGLRRVPCMIGLVRSIRTNEPQAIHRTALDLAGNKVLIDGLDRMTLGPVGGGAVKLSADEDVTTCLGIGEGIESVLSLRLTAEFGMSPVWALISAGGLEVFPVLAGLNVCGSPSTTIAAGEANEQPRCALAGGRMPDRKSFA